MQKMEDSQLIKAVADMPKVQRARLVRALKSAGKEELFGWMNWSPLPGTGVHTALRKHFPGALPGRGLRCRTEKVLKERFGFTDENTLFGCSICPDEINNLKGSITS